MTDESGYEDIAKDALVSLTKEAYSDGLKPSVSRIGNALGTLTGLLDTMLSPARIFIHRSDVNERLAKEEITRALEARRVPDARLIYPSLTVTVPALQAMSYAADSPELRGMFAALLAEAMDSETAHLAHPAFVDVLRQLTPDEARIIKLFAHKDDFPLWDVETITLKRYADGLRHKEVETQVRSLSLLGYDADCQYLDLVPSYIGNLVRLGLCYITTRRDPHIFRDVASLDHPNYDYCHERTGELIERRIEVKNTVAEISSLTGDEAGSYVNLWTRLLRVTAFGRQFCTACIVPLSND